MNEMSEKCNVAQYLSQICKLPDHSILQVNFKLSEDTNINNEELHHNEVLIFIIRKDTILIMYQIYFQ